VQHALVVELALHRDRRRRLAGQLHARRRAQGRDLARRALEQVLVGMDLAFGLLARGFAFALQLLLLLQLPAQPAQVLQGFGFQSRPFSAIDRASPGATIT
jgi:hypothetical protein